MTPFSKLAHVIGRAKGYIIEPKPISDAEIMRARFARWLRQCHDAGFKIPDLIDRIHSEPSESDWLPGIDDDPKRDRS